MGDREGRVDTVSPADVKVREVPRRQFLRGIGLLVSASALTLGGCELLVPSDIKVRADRDVNVTVTDFDPFDPPNRIVRHGDPIPNNDFD